MSSKITVIGAGSVGSTIAYTLSNQNVASEIVLIDINKEKVEGEVMDIAQGTCFRDPISIIAGEYEDAKDSDIVIITSGIARKPGHRIRNYSGFCSSSLRTFRTSQCSTEQHSCLCIW